MLLSALRSVNTSLLTKRSRTAPSKASCLLPESHSRFWAVCGLRAQEGETSYRVLRCPQPSVSPAGALLLLVVASLWQVESTSADLGGSARGGGDTG